MNKIGEQSLWLVIVPVKLFRRQGIIPFRVIRSDTVLVWQSMGAA